MVSIIVPAYNAEKTIGRLIDSFSRQNYAKDYEVIIVDDGSSDSTAEIVSQYKNIKLIRQNNSGPAAARNRGVFEAMGQIILFTDSDCEVSSGWIEQMIAPFEENPQVVGVKGVYQTRQEEFIARFVQLEYEDKYDIMKKDSYIDFIDTYSAGFKKEAFLNVGGYDSTFPVACAEDVDLSYRLARKGYKMVFNPKAVVFHKHPTTLKAYLRKKFKFAYWRVKAVRNNPDKVFKDSHTPFAMKLQVILFLFILLAIPFSLRHFYIITVMLIVYFINAIPFIVKALKKDMVVGFMSLPVLFLRSGAQLLGLAGGIIRRN